jgi:hypothetical protein
MSLVLKMATPQQRRWCVLQFAKKESVTAVQCTFRTQFHTEPPSQVSISKYPFNVNHSCQSFHHQGHCTKFGMSWIIVLKSAVWLAEHMSSLCEVCAKLLSFSIDWRRCEVLSMPHLFSVSFWKCKVLLCLPCISSIYFTVPQTSLC